MSAPIEIQEMRRLHACNVEYEYQESVEDFTELKKRIKLAKQKIKIKKRSSGS